MSSMTSRLRTQTDLDVYRTRLSGCVQAAINEFIADLGKHLYFWRPGSQANVLRDYIVRNIKREFPDGVDGVRHQEKRGLFLLYISDAYALRFKKLGRGRRTMNHPTQLSLDFLLQQPLQLFPDLAPALHLNVGYHPGATLASSTAWITCPDGGALEWEWQISEDGDPMQIPTSLLPAGPTPVQLRRPRARPKPLPGVGELTDGPGT
jgi:hypothetical protein